MQQQSSVARASPASYFLSPLAADYDFARSARCHACLHPSLPSVLVIIVFIRDHDHDGKRRRAYDDGEYMKLHKQSDGRMRDEDEDWRRTCCILPADARRLRGTFCSCFSRCIRCSIQSLCVYFCQLFLTIVGAGGGERGGRSAASDSWQPFHHPSTDVRDVRQRR